MSDEQHQSQPAREAVNEAVPGVVRPMAQRKARLYGALLVLLVFGMFGFAYANAEFFVMICRKAGLLSQDPAALQGSIKDGPVGRPLEVFFSAHVSDQLPIVFSVSQRLQKTNIGARAMNDYKFVNTSNQTVYFKPVHDVYPTVAGMPENMILEACFCFTQQKLEPFQSYTMPVVYTFTDKTPEKVGTIKMSYSLHPSDKASYEAAMAAWEAGLKEADAHGEAQAPK